MAGGRVSAVAEVQKMGQLAPPPAFSSRHKKHAAAAAHNNNNDDDDKSREKSPPAVIVVVPHGERERPFFCFLFFVFNKTCLRTDTWLCEAGRGESRPC
jgi:hypothetical protein